MGYAYQAAEGMRENERFVEALGLIGAVSVVDAMYQRSCQLHRDLAIAGLLIAVGQRVPGLSHNHALIGAGFGLALVGFGWAYNTNELTALGLFSFGVSYVGTNNSVSSKNSIVDRITSDIGFVLGLYELNEYRTCA